jgi:cytochrome c-type biogenesis protein CcmF
MVHYLVGDLGHLFLIISFVTSLVAAFTYFKATRTEQIDVQEAWKKNARLSFYFHVIAVIGASVCLFAIIYNHYFEYHYAYRYSSKTLPTHYMVSTFWNGQEGSFLLWIIWNAVIGLILIKTNKFWEAPVMVVFALVQAFLASMILGVVIPGIDFKIGSSPFILLREAIEAPIFKMQPDFVPSDGQGLNPLLQNYWMVIHPPTLFLGYASTLLPFAYALAGLWFKKYSEWVRPALPWALFSGAVLGLGILMGGYWAYETLNFGGYWNWDPVENAVYVPWLILVGAIHTMITYKNSETALKASIILSITTFILILYATFLTRSGVLGDASVHSFTDLGLNGQLLLYMMFFSVMAFALLIARWKHIPTSTKEASTYSREFWIFIGVTVLCLMGFQVLLPTSFPVFNNIVGAFGGVSKLAPPADQVEFYSRFQLWFAVALALLSGTGQFFWWKKIDGKKLWAELSGPVLITLVVWAIVISVGKIFIPSLMVLSLAALYTIIANAKIGYSVIKSNPSLSGGAIAHIGVGMMLLGIVFSSGYSKVVSLNNSGLLISNEFSTDFNRENLLLFVNEPKTMAGYEIEYLGERIEPRHKWGYISKSDVNFTADPFTVIAKNDIIYKSRKLFEAGESFQIYPENTYYEIQFRKEGGKTFSLYPRVQINPDMGGFVASPDISRGVTRDIYTHVNQMIKNPDEDYEWSDMEEITISAGEEFYANDYVSKFEKVERVFEVDGITFENNDVAVKGVITLQGRNQTYVSEPLFIIKDGMIGRLPDDIGDLGVRLTILNIMPETNQFTLGIETRQKDWVVLKALEKPLINVLWLGTLMLMFGFGIAVNRRLREFIKMRDKGQE